MSEEIKNTETQTTNATPAETGEPAGKMFTQEEVNKIVSERLARDREKRSTQQQEDERETALKARESKLDCREYLTEKKYPVELIDILDTYDVNKFKAVADQLQQIYGVDDKRPRFANPPIFTAPKSNNPVNTDPFRDAFKPKA